MTTRPTPPNRSTRAAGLSDLSPAKRALLQHALHRKLAVAGERLAPPPRRGPVPLTPFQRGIWLTSTMAPDRAVFVMRACVRLRGPLQGVAVARAVDTLVGRHDALRSVIRLDDDEPCQEVAADVRIEIGREDLSSLPVGERLDQARRLAAAAMRPFDLARGPLVRAAIHRLDEDDHVLLLMFHHVIADGVSASLLLSELAEIYAADVEGRAVALSPVAWQFADVARWSQEHHDAAAEEASLAAAQARLADAPVTLSLPFDRPRPSRPTYPAAELRLRLEPGLIEPLGSIARAEGATLFMGLLACLHALVGRLSGADSVLLAFPVSRRERREHAAVIGPLLNTLVLRGDLAGQPSFRALLGRTRDDTLLALRHPDVPFERLAERLDPGSHPERPSLCQVLCSWAEPGDPPRFADVAAEPLPVPTAAMDMDLVLDLEPRGDGVEVLFTYNTEVFDESTVRRIGDQLRDLVAAAVAEPDRALGSRLSPSEEDLAAIAAMNQTARPYPAELSVWQLFAEVAGRSPDAVAIEEDDAAITYRELHERAQRMAGRLAALGVGREDRVALALPRGADLVASMLGALALDAGYLALDPTHPADRLAFQIADSGALVLVTRGDVLPAPAGVERLDLGAFDPGAGPVPALPAARAGGDGLACVMYTSGSTGVPKGVAVVHRGITRMVCSPSYPMFRPVDRIVFGSNPTFDAATLEIHGALLNGACLVVAGGDLLMDPARLHGWLRARRITSIVITTSLFNHVVRERPDAFAGLDHVLVAGEAQVPRWCRRALEASPGITLINGYGPTEATTWSTAFTVAGVAPGQTSIPIGTPISNCRAYAIGEDLELVPVGMIGELCIAGDGLARGYVGRPDLTAASFVPDPMSATPGGRLYRTGDRVRLLPRGGFDFLGRRDGQIKLRGLRIEIGEIESRLAACAGVAEAVVTVVGDQPDERRLVGHVVLADGGPGDPEAIAAELGRTLPDYMVPSIAVLPSLPRTSAGKLDRQRLPSPADAPVPAPCPPRTPLESIVATVFGHALGGGPVARDQHFFQSGGNSLKAAEVAFRLAVLCGVEVPHRLLFDEPTVAGVAAWIARARRGEIPSRPPIARIDRSGPLPVSPTQARMWFLDRLTPDQAAYNVPVATELRGPLDIGALGQAVTSLVQRHETLRTRYLLVDGELTQRIDPAGPVELRREEMEPGVDRTAVLARVAELTSRPFALGAEWPLRVHLLRRAADDHVLLLLFHHIAFDGASVPVVFDELAAAYAAVRAGRSIPLQAPAIQMADVAAWQRRLAEDPSQERDLDHWRRRLAGPLPRLALPADRPRAALERGPLGLHRFTLPVATAEALDRLGRDLGATRFMTTLAAFAAWIHRLTAEPDVLVGTPIAGRDDPAVERLVGAFINTLALRIDIADRPSLRELMARARTVALEAYDHAGAPFERVVEALQIDRDLTREPVFEVMFAFTEGVPPALRLDGLAAAPLESEGATAKLDLELALHADGTEWVGHLFFDRLRFDESTAARLARSFVQLLEAGLDDPDVPVARLPLLSAEEIRWSRDRAEGAPLDAPPASPCPALEATAARRGSAVAVIEDGRPTTYAELGALSHGVARRLGELGLAAEARVLVLAERSVAAIAAIVGGLRAGVTLVPIEPGLPEERLRLLVADAAPACVILSRAELAGEVSFFTGPIVDASSVGPAAPVAGPMPLPEQAACVLYTSGSTGAPKGVVLTHGALGSYTRSFQALTALDDDDRLLQFHSLAFDASLEEILGALVTGARLVLRPPGPPGSFAAFAEWLDREAVTVLDLPTAYWHEWMRGQAAAPPASVRMLVVSGEAASAEAYRAWRVLAPVGSAWLNAYGPTEITCLATALRLESGDRLDASPSIGRPIPGARAHVLGPEQELLPAGCAGELYLGGPGVARGYLGSPGLTAARFVPDPLGAGARLYRTGDRAKVAPDGQIHFLGRVDFQVKLRGHRIELGEVEAGIAAEVPGSEVIVLLRADDPGSPRLVAYVAPPRGVGVDPEALAARLARRLPAPMLPAAILVLDELPLTAAGKVDRDRLPAPIKTAPVSARPADPLERLLLEIWCDVLELDDVGLADSFFTVGGHSLLATRVLARLQDLLDLDVPVRSIFEAPSITSFAAELAARHERAELNRMAQAVLEVAGIEA